ncbi:MAG: helix-turn-helix domain-containing protein [Verrucomicrobiales bacterium]|nr:helix-turn-helix domain-containing protein [Verrucomicrobiales bacterium]
MATIGQRLGEARRASGMSVADVSHETHIHSNMIHNIEEDDFSKFASVAYAKSFIRNYAEFLGVDLGGTMDALDSSKTLRLGEHELMGEMKKTIKKDRRFRLQRGSKSSRRLDKPGGAPVFLNLILFSLIAAIAVFYFLGYKAGSVEEARDEITKGLQKANPFGEEGVETDSPSESPAKDEIPEASLSKVTEPPKKEAPTLQRVELVPATSETGSPVVEVPVESSLPGEPETVPALTDAIEKPEVSWKVEESKPSPLARAGSDDPETLKSRETPGLKIESEEIPVVPVQSAELPTIKRALEEPAAALRPAGTDPVPKPEASGGDEDELPVAASE